jgi:hypothetical protein
MKQTRLAAALLAPLMVLLAGACSVGSPDATDEDEDEYVDPGVSAADGKMDGASSVDSVSSSTCSTVPVRGLSIQIAEEVRCLAPGLLVPFAETGSIQFTSQAVLPYLEADTYEALRKAAPTVGTITVNSGLRSIAQQFLLRRWRDQGRCGIRSAAAPGRSNHETGRAVDLGNSAAARATMVRTGFSTLSFDPVHFDHLTSPDLRDMGIEAFQRLWNRNHPEDTISEDGDYGPETAKRLARAPSGGFATGAVCGP